MLTSKGQTVPRAAVITALLGVALLSAALFSASTASAGAWLRAEGTGFSASSLVLSETGQASSALYLEYGWRPRLTLGLRIDADMTLGRLGDGSGFVFVRRPVGSVERSFRLAYEIGVGSTFGQGSDMLLLTGLSYGRGVSIGSRHGWLAIDGAVEWSLGDRTDTAKLDTTFGLAVTDRFKVMVQVFVSQTDTASSLTTASSVIWQPRDSRASYQIGIEVKNSAPALKLGLWREF
jgi:hypothetical protein